MEIIENPDGSLSKLVTVAVDKAEEARDLRRLDDAAAQPVKTLAEIEAEADAWSGEDDDRPIQIGLLAICNQMIGRVRARKRRATSAGAAIDAKLAEIKAAEAAAEAAAAAAKQKALDDAKAAADAAAAAAAKAASDAAAAAAAAAAEIAANKAKILADAAPDNG